MDNITLYVLPIGDNENGYIIPENTANVLLRQLVPGQTIIQGGEAISISEQANFRIETTANNVEKIEPSVSKISKFALMCTMCQIEFSNAKQYKEHITKHFKKKFKCEKCGTGFNKEVNFTIHALTEHSDNLTCPFCNVSFQRKAAFQSHVKLHKSEETHCCEFCKVEFSHEDELVRHIKNHNFPVEISDLICNYCKLLLPDVESYKKHLDSHKKLTKTITQRKIIRRKVPISPNKNYSHRCYACDKTFPKFSLLERHNRIHSGEKPFSCGFCNKRFNQKGTLKIHMTCHTGYKPFVCTLCPAKFNQKCNLKSHVRKTHSAPKDGETTFKCSECDCLFKKIGSLNTHVNKAHSASVMDQLKQLENDLNPIDSGLISFNKNTNKNTNKNNQEEISNITYEDVISNENTEKSKELYIKLTETIGRPSGRLRTYLIKLVMIDNVKNYECMYCKNLFKKPSDLLRHLRIHTNERPFKCKVCSSNFRVKSTLTKHMNTHDTRNTSSFQKYGCSSCDSTFSSIFAYNKHFRTKHNTKKAQDKTLSVDEKMENNSQNITTDLVLREPLLETNQGLLPLTKNESPYRPHICQKCNASFSKKTHLKRHMYSHEEKKFKCTKCSKSYSFQNALKDHMKFHNPVKKFECSECTKKFVTKSLLLRHLISHSESTPFICPYCNKKFKSINFCRRHIKIHKRHLLEMLQDGQTNENNIHEEILKNPPLNKATKNQQATKNFISKNNEYLLTTNITPNNETPESNSTISDVDNTSKVYNINFVDLDMNEMIYSQTKLQNSDSIILNSIQDFQENNLLFNVQDTQANSGNNLELYTPIFASNSTENDTEIPVKEKETNSVTLQNYNLLENVTFLPNVTFTSNGENEYNINILEGSTEPQVQNDQLTIISGENFDQNYVINFCNACKKIFNSSEHICEPESENATEVSEITVPEENIDTINNVNEQQQSTEQIYVNDDPINAENDQQELTKSVSVNDKIKKKNVKDESKKKTVDRICSFCEKEFKKPSDLIRHVRIHTGEKPFQCDICQKRFALKCTLDSHVKTHSSLAEKFTCTICNKNFSSKTSRKLHMSIHTGQKPYSCKFCDLNFRTIANKNSHEKSIHLNPKKVHKPKATDILEKAAMESLDTLFTGNNHENIVNNEIQLSATEAIEILNPSNNLPFDSNLIQPIQNGSLILTDDNVANMDLLQNTVIHFIDSDSILNFTKQTDLTTEKDALNNGEIYINWLQTQPSDDLSIQNNIAPNSIQQNMVQNNITESLECEICKKECSSKEMLRKHLNLHKKKKFMCGVCLKLFENADDLEVHSDTHNGVRTFCNYCDNAFFDEQHLKTHMKRIHQV